MHNITEAAKLIRPDDEVVYGDAGYLGLDKRPEILEAARKSQIDYHIGPSRDWYCRIEYQKASVRAKVEHAYHIIKNTFGFSKVSYRG